MTINAFRRQADPAQIGWTIGHAPLWLRGIRLIEGEGGSAPSGGGNGDQPPAGGANPPTPSPANLAAFYASQKPGQTPPAAPTPQVQQVQGFTPEQVQKLMADNAAAQKALEDAQNALTKANEERDDYKGQVTQFAREKAVTTAADGKANAALLLDSASFQAAIKDLDLNDAAALGTAVEQFVKDNPAYAAVAAPTLPPTSGGTPAGGSTTKPTTLEGAIAAALGG